MAGTKPQFGDYLRRLSVTTAHVAKGLTAAAPRRPVSNPVGAMVAGGDAKGASKAATTAWAELVRGLRRRGPAAKGDASLSAALSRLTDAQGDRPAALPFTTLTDQLSQHAVVPNTQQHCLVDHHTKWPSLATEPPAAPVVGAPLRSMRGRAPTRWHRGAALLSCTASTATWFLVRRCRRAAVEQFTGGADCALDGAYTCAARTQVSNKAPGGTEL